MKTKAQLSDQLETVASEAASVAEDLDELVRYLQSSKFRCGDELDGYVSINDLLPRLYAMRGTLGGAIADAQS